MIDLRLPLRPYEWVAKATEGGEGNDSRRDHTQMGAAGGRRILFDGFAGSASRHLNTDKRRNDHDRQTEIISSGDVRKGTPDC